MRSQRDGSSAGTLRWNDHGRRYFGYRFFWRLMNDWDEAMGTVQCKAAKPILK
jgi:hypothetical protein